ncbi:MAG: HAMP domain-containing histidine kinase [Xanthobacteraceae bacterium]|nr:HAMP domain-containing histidine kinase [Xanthobacteraceae bacterium]QYK45816.1 MAG: HAMP domain-containing histidine kinase [Xanthobacteraceae bacterium]
MGGNSSLARRLFLSATAVSVVFLVVIGILLSTLYRNSVERAFDRRLNLYLRNIVAEVANNPRPPLSEPETLGEPLFLIPNSGWYWQILRLGESSETKLSRSTPDEGLVTLLAQNVKQRKDGLRQGYMNGPDGQRLRVVERLLDIGDDGRFLITVSGDSVEIDEEAAEFNYALFITFALLALAFILTVGFQVRYGLRPLSRISGALSEIRSGRAERLAGDFPREIDPLAREVNALLESNREIVERARTHVGNLAHALKTPLSVLMNEAGHMQEPGGDKIREQLNIMRDQVTRHLERARIAARTAVFSSTIDVGPVVATIARTMEKIHRERGVSIHTRTDEPVKFRGEQQDLEEMLGNLVDNACKWANSRIDIELYAQPSQRGAGNTFFRLQVDDDGPGLAPNEREEVLRRGRRLDESKPGTGLGLSIVLDLAKLYGGSLELGNSPLGGLRAALLLPAVRA